MDVSFSAKPKTPTIISSHTLSSSSSSFSSQFCIFRKELFGSRCHRLRPPELHSRRRKFNKLGFQIQPTPRFLVRASLSSSQPIVVIVAVAAAFSALTVIYFEYNRRRRRNNNNNNNNKAAAFKEVSGHKEENPLVLEPSKQEEETGGVFRKQGIESHIQKELEIIDGESTETPMKQSSKLTLTEKINQNGNGHVSEETILVVQQQQHHHHHKTKASEPPVFVDVSMKQAAAAMDLLAFPPMEKISQLVLEPEVSAKERNELSSKGHQAEEVSYPELCRQTVETNSATSTSTAPVEHSHASEIQQETSSPDLCQQMVEPISIAPVEHAHAEIQQDHRPKHETGETVEIQVSGHNGHLTESVREELHKFHKENQSGVESISNFSEEGSNGFSSLLRPTMTTSAEVSTQDSHTTTGLRAKISEYLEQEMHLASNGRGSSRKRKNIGKEVGFPIDVGKSPPSQNGQRGRRIFPQPNGVQVNGERDPSEYLNTYNRWVRDGRLFDCVKLLQSVERLGLLNMDKVYHSRFFNTCKSQKAIKEAFSFTKLIRNPTLSTFNMLLSVCASSQDSEGAFQVLQLVKEAGLKADCKLYTTLISTCAKSGKVDAMFEVFHQMVNAGVVPNVNTYGALIDGCARAGQVAKAFGAYGILRSKNVKPDRVVFNALITACGQSGAVDRAFDVLAEMGSELPPINPDHVTIGALIKTCAQAGQFDRAHEVYKMIHQYNIKGTPEVYTIAVNSCSQMGDLDFALIVYDDMKKNEVVPDEMCLSTLINVAGRAGKIDVAFKILQEARVRGTELGNVSYSSLMGACSNAKDWKMALKLYEDIKSIKLCPTVSTLNALITALCDGDQLQKATEVLDYLKKVGVRPNIITYSVLLVACEKKDELELGALLHSQAKKDGVVPNLTMCGCLIGMCLRRFRKAYTLGEPTLSFNSGKPQIDNKWTSLALTVYREMIISGVVPTIDIFSQVLGCLQFPHDTSMKTRLVENLGVSIDASKSPNLTSLIDGFGEYDPCSFSLLEEAGSLGVLPCVSFKKNPITVDARQLPIHTAEVYILTILKGLKHRLAAGANLPTVNILLSVEKAKAVTPKGEKTFNIVGRIGIAVGALLRRIGLYYQGNESYGKVRISGLAIKRWLQPKLESPFSGKPAEFNTSETRLGKAIVDQQRDIRSFDLSLE